MEQYEEDLESTRQLGYQAKFDEVRKRAAKDLSTDVKKSPRKMIYGFASKTGDVRKEQEPDTSTDGYKAAVIGGLLGSFEENFWWWKLFLMLERATLAILITFEASSWYAVVVAGTCWLASAICRPYFSRAEDWLDIMVRLTTFFACTTAALI